LIQECCDTTRESQREYNRNYDRRRLAVDPQFKIAKLTRSRLHNAVRQNFKSGSAVRDLGCSIAELKQHLERQFQPGMTWENYGEWHIDHKRPLASFDLTDREQFLQAVHYSNLQPLWASENCSKGARWVA
jgi:hypothetical protein